VSEGREIKVVHARMVAPRGPPLHVLRPEVKALDLGTESAKAVYWRAFERLRLRWYGSFARLVAKEFEAERKEVMRSLEGRSPHSAEGAIETALIDSRERWTKFYKAAYLAIGEDFAPMVEASINGKDYSPADNSSVSSGQRSNDQWVQFLLDWISRQSGVKISQIQDVTLDRIRAQLSEGITSGESMEDIAKRLGSIYDDNVSGRAMRIARTEVINASNAASYAGAKGSGAKVRKKWLSSRDGRVRTAHATADGQIVDMDAPFRVGGYELMWPGDTSRGAPAALTVNCRCTQSYVRR